MEERMQRRLEELKREYEAGQNRLQELAREHAEVQQTLLRISGAIQVLDEELGNAEPAKRDHGAPSEEAPTDPRDQGADEFSPATMH